MFEFDEEELRRIAELHMGDLDSKLRQELVELTDDLRSGDWPVKVRQRGVHGDVRAEIPMAILEELKALFCTNDRRWSSVRKQSKDFSKAALYTIAGYIAGT